MTALGWLWFGAVAGIVVTVAVIDWRRRFVGNGLVVALTVLAAVFVGFGDAEAVVTSRWWSVAATFAVLLVGLGTWAAGLIGAGDVKLLVPVALIMVRLGAIAWLFYLGVFIAGAVIVMTVFSRRGQTFPLAPVLGLGVIPALLAAPPPWFVA